MPKVPQICCRCGTAFLAWAYKNRKFCSRECEFSTGRIDVPCARCGKMLQRQLNQLKTRKRTYCSAECRRADASSPGSRGGIVSIACEQCGKVVSQNRWRFKRYEHHFCSRTCLQDWEKSGNAPSGEDHHQYKRVMTKCAQCSSDVARHPYRISAFDNQFCSKSCYSQWMSEHMRGPDHPLWAGGHRFYRGPNWHSQRLLALKRDGYRCVSCGTKDEKGNRTQVHHIIPFRMFGYKKGENDNHIQANELSNLACLCKRCHKLVEHGKLDLRRIASTT